MNDKNKLILNVSLIWVLIIIVLGVLTSNDYLQNNQKGLRIDKEYIRSITGQEAYVNDVYVTTMINFADKCGGNQSFYRFSDNKGRLHGVTLWCRHNLQSFTFYYSDKWRIENYGKK